MAKKRWIERPEIWEYVVDAYAGTEPIERSNRGGATKRRVFIWDDGEEIRMGNIETFADHLMEKFDLIVTPRSVATSINQLLLDLGERIRNRDRERRESGQYVGDYQPPEPESWVLGQRPEVVDGEV